MIGCVNRPGYLELLRDGPFARFMAATGLTRMGGNMFNLAIVLFTLARFHSPVLVGLIVLVSWAPGMALGPLAGALLERYGQTRLMALDMAMGVSMITGIVVLTFTGHLSAAVILLVTGLGSLTVPLAIGGSRTMLPLLVPKSRWARANAFDSAVNSLTSILGPAVAGLLIATAGDLVTLVLIALTWLAAAVLLLSIGEPVRVRAARQHILREAWMGVRHVLKNPVLRGVSFTLPLSTAGAGCLYVALPVLALRWPHSGSAIVGLLWTVFGVAALVGSLALALFRTEGHERRVMVVAQASQVPIAVLLVVLGGPIMAFVAMAAFGATEGPFEVSMFTLRQRYVDPTLLGRAMTVSVAINSIGRPFGSALAGPLVARDPRLGLLAAAGFWLAAALACLLALPEVRRSTRGTRSGPDRD